MLLEDLYQQPSIFVSAFENVMHTNPALIKNVGEFNDLGTALNACRNFAIEMVKLRDTEGKQDTRTDTNGIVNKSVEGPDIKAAKAARFVRAGTTWVCDAGRYMFVAMNTRFPNEAEAAQSINSVL